MNTFLGLVAKDLLAKRVPFDELTIIFPNKRAGLFLADEFKKLIDSPTWMPEIMTLDEFVVKALGEKCVDELTAIIKMYKIYCAYSPKNADTSLSDFYYWGKMLLGDFDDVDKYLVDAKTLFSNVDNYRNMEDTSLSYLDEKQRAILSHFFDFVGKKESEQTERFVELWNNLSDYYQLFKDALRKEHLVYPGMAQRRLCEEQLLPKVGTIVFAGFNALNKCEKRIFDYYRDSKKALFYWDYDTYYIKNEVHEAGFYMRENLQHYRNELGLEYFNNFEVNRPSITVIDVPNQVAQAKILPAVLGPNPGRESAVVLCDETLLIPVKNSLPDSIESVNITMGMPAQNSSVAGLISEMYALSLYDNRRGYYFKPVLKILEHPLVRCCNKTVCDDLISTINTLSVFRVPVEQLEFNAVVKALFVRDGKNSLEWIISVLDALLRVKELKNRVLDRETLFSLYTYLRSIEKLFEKENIIKTEGSDDKLLLSLINKLLSFTSIPFSGQPLRGLQLMGLMETRMLDFDNLVLLSVNEGVIPKSGIAPSFIPVSFRKAFEMPVPEHRDAIFAYYFYRLLQRTKKATMVYVSGRNDGMGAEISRFLLQLKYESGIDIEWKSLRNCVETSAVFSEQFSKSKWVMDRLKKKNNLSPSALSDYIICPRKFFLNNVANLREEDSVSDDIDARIQGNFLHESAKLAYQELSSIVGNGDINKEDINALLNSQERIASILERALPAAINNKVNNSYDNLPENGSYDLAKIVVERYLRNILIYDRDHCCPFSIIKLEEWVKMPITLDSGQVVNIGGIVDRIDRVGTTIRIVDYKTGSDLNTYTNLNNLFDVSGSNHEKAPFQTMLYSLAFLADSNNDFNYGMSVLPLAYLVRNMSKDNYDPHFVNKEGVLESFDAGMQNAFLHKLKDLVNNIFDESIDFTVASNEKKCVYCPFSVVCGRQ